MESYRDAFEIMNGPGFVFDATNIEWAGVVGKYRAGD